MKVVGIIGAVTLWGLLLLAWLAVLVVGWVAGSLIQWRKGK